MTSPQVQQWLNDGSRLQDEMEEALASLEAQQKELQEKLETQRREVAVMHEILDRASNPALADEKDRGHSFDAKASSQSNKAQNKDEWHPGV